MGTANTHAPYKDKSFITAFCLYTVYCLTMVFKAFSAVSVQMPIVLLCFVLLLHSTSRKRSTVSSESFLLLAITILVFNFLFFYLKKESGMSDYTFVNKVGANFTLFNCMFPVLLVCSGGFERADTSKMRRFALFVTLFTSITTIYGTYLFSGASPCRELATGQNSSVLAIYKMANIGGYGYIYYLVIITPCLVRLLLKRFSWNVLIVLLCNFYCIIRSEYTTALLLTFLGLCLSIMMFSKSKLLKVAMVMVGVLALTSFGQQLLYWGISQFSDSYSVSSRLEMVAEFSETGSTYGDMEDRGMLYNMSWNTFLDNPIFGGRFSDMCKLGNHSEFLDFLGYSGLVGMICLFMYLVYIARHTKIRSIKWSEPYNRITLIIAIVLASINTFMAPEMYYALVVIPLLTTDTTN